MEILIYSLGHDADSVLGVGQRSAAICSAAHFTSRLFPGTHFSFRYWDGKLESLPTDQQVLVDAFVLHEKGRSGVNGDQYPSVRELVDHCETQGHLVFFLDALLTSQGMVHDRQQIEESTQAVFECLRTSQDNEER